MNNPFGNRKCALAGLAGAAAPDWLDTPKGGGVPETEKNPRSAH